MTKEIKKEHKFFALIIPVKHFNNFIRSRPELEHSLRGLSDAYADYRKSIGKNAYNGYIICNQDEPYAGKVWDIILKGENQKKREKS